MGGDGRWDARRHALRVQGRDLLQLWLLPGLAAVLPWRWCFALYRRLARWPWLYRAEVEAALAGAQLRGWLAPAEAARWATERRLVSLVDHADFFLSRTRGDGWLRRHVEVRGQWPAHLARGTLVRFSLGLESVADLQADLAQALSQALPT